MEYPIIQPPFSLDFDTMTKKELKAYKEWFFYILPERIEILIRYVQSTQGFETWNPDYSPDSLNVLGEWFAKKVETRPTTKEEQAEQLSRGTILKTYSEWVFTNKTYSLCIDIGMYLAEVFLKNHPCLEWTQRLTGKTCADYGRPAIKSFGKHRTFEPVHMLKVQASIIMDTKRGDGLREVYGIWEKLIEPPISESAK